MISHSKINLEVFKEDNFGMILQATLEVNKTNGITIMEISENQ